MINETLVEIEKKSNFIKIDSQYTVHYHDIGEGYPFILLHGGGPGASGLGNFKHNISEIVEAGYRVIIPDFLGFNFSDPIVSDEPLRKRNSNTVKRLMNALDIEKAHVLGNSMGGQAALTFAIENPEMVDKLVLLGPGGVFASTVFTPKPTEGSKALFELFKNPTYEGIAKLCYLFAENKKVVTDALIEERWNSMMQDDAIHMKNFVKTMEIAPPIFEDISEQIRMIQHKTLLIWGRDDRFANLDDALRFLWELPNAQLHIFSNCGHWAQLECKEEFNKLVTNFLKK